VACHQRRRLGFVGAWLMARPAVQAYGGTGQLGKRLVRRTFGQGLLLGLLGGGLGRSGARCPPADGALGNAEGESGWGLAADLARAGLAAAPPRAFVPASHSNFYISSAPHGAVGRPRGAR
jgi:hypothetical protein